MKMNVLLLLLLMAPTAQAQLHIPKPAWGVKAGVNNAHIKDIDELCAVRTDLFLGVFAEWAFGPFAISPELLYSREGGRSSDFVYVGSNTFTMNDRGIRLRTSYLQLPVAFKLYFGNASFDAGIQYSHLLGSDIELEGYGESDAASVRRRVGRATLNTALFSTFIGCTAIVSPHLGLSARIVYGLTPVLRDVPGRAVNYQVGMAWAF